MSTYQNANPSEAQVDSNAVDVSESQQFSKRRRRFGYIFSVLTRHRLRMEKKGLFANIAKHIPSSLTQVIEPPICKNILRNVNTILHIRRVRKLMEKN
ncbi:hypothetical protein V6N12_035706 [Hibiscus sabdariffa]|uniref:Uncharacterized protein n=1 Tax=Hibiscus sabdariffa TaxID=183260 RepID=A0ABR2ENH6_9ROSI